MSAERERRRIADFLSHEWGRLVAAVRSWIEDEADRDAEDIVQDVMEGLFERPDLTEPVRDLSAFVWRSVRNRVVDRYRARRAAPSLDAAGPGGAGTLAESLSDGRWDVPSLSEQGELRERVFAAINDLPDNQRAVFLATELEGRKFRELAADWDVPLGTLLARKHRAVARLRSALSQIGREEGVSG